MDSTAGIVWLLLERDLGKGEIRHSSRTDPLTALLGQRAFVAEATRYIARLERDGDSGTLMLAEVDNLEAVTVLQGGEGADQTLRRAAMLLQSAVRPSDLLGRTGDAEFFQHFAIGNASRDAFVNREATEDEHRCVSDNRQQD